MILPEDFSEEKRTAYLVGEAFFDIVKKPKYPFFVETSSAVIKVLGTSFHVSAYPDRKELTAFLQEGKVRFRSTDHALFASWVDLKPNEQANLDRETKSITVQKGDQTYYQLWKDGIVSFNDEPVQYLLARVGQFFNISISCADQQVSSRRIKGKLDLNNELAEVFEYIEKITDRKIVKVNAGKFELN
jgi:ferric-dicitrate binding protein FerR (iron transport regulator)